MAQVSRAEAARNPGEGVRKPKKAVLASGGRSWGESEEAYLVQTRNQKMPYKHIAAHLKKTELACRLHYHQLLRGAGRRKRSDSQSSRSEPLAERPTSTLSAGRQTGRDAAAGVGTSYAKPRVDAPSSSSSRPGDGQGPQSPAGEVPLAHGYGHGNRHESGRGHEYGQSMAAASTGATPLLPSPFKLLPTILPKPTCVTACGTPCAPSGAPAGFPGSVAAGGYGAATTRGSPRGPSRVDLARLQDIYEGRKAGFWAAVAREYGDDVSAAALEAAWRTSAWCPCRVQRPGSRPMTPAASPKTVPRMTPPTTTTTTTMTTTTGSFAGRDRIKIAAILAAEDDWREVRRPVAVPMRDPR